MKSSFWGQPGPQLTANVPVVGKADDKPYWYLFVFDSNKGQYKVWRTDQQSPSDPSKAAFDTADWYAQLEGSGKLTLMTRKQRSSVKIDGRIYDTDNDGYLSGTSANTMQQHAMILTWVEVGGRGQRQ